MSESGGFLECSVAFGVVYDFASLVGSYVNFYPANKFCELGKKKRDWAARPCKRFQLTLDQDTRRRYFRQRRKTRAYFAKLECACGGV